MEFLTVSLIDPVGFGGVITIPSSVRSTPSRSGSSTTKLNNVASVP